MIGCTHVPVNTGRLSSRKFLRFLVAAGCLALALTSFGSHAQTAAAESDAELAREVLAEINFARTHPDRYADYLEGNRSHYRGDTLALPGETPIRTREGVRALDEAVRVLRRTRPLPPLDLSVGLGRAAADLAHEQSQTGALGHRSGNGASPFSRMSRHGQWQVHAGEAIQYGAATARRIVYHLIVDDGVRDRGHRLNLLSPDFRVAGVAQASHPRYRHVCVIDFAATFTGPDEMSPTDGRDPEGTVASLAAGGGGGNMTMAKPVPNGLRGILPRPPMGFGFR